MVVAPDGSMLCPLLRTVEAAVGNRYGCPVPSRSLSGVEEEVRNNYHFLREVGGELLAAGIVLPAMEVWVGAHGTPRRSKVEEEGPRLLEEGTGETMAG